MRVAPSVWLKKSGSARVSRRPSTGGDHAEGLEDAGEDPADSFADDAGDGDRVQRHLAHLEEASEDVPHQHATREETDVVDDRQNEPDAEANRARQEPADLRPHLAERPQHADRSGDVHGLEGERRELLVALRVEEQTHGRPDLGHRGREIAALELERHVGVDEMKHPGRDKGTRDDGQGLGPELPGGPDLVPEAVGHIGREIARLSATPGDHAGAGEIGRHARSAEHGRHALKQNAHDTRRVEGGLRRGPRSDEVQDEATDGDHADQDQKRELEVEVQRQAGEADTDDGEQNDSPLGHDRGVVRAATDMGQRHDRLRDHLPVQKEVGHARGDEKRDPGPDELLGSRRGLQVRRHEQKDHGAGQEADRAAEAHQVGAADQKRRQSDAQAIGGEPGHREHDRVRDQPKTIGVRDDVADRERDEDAQIPGLLGVTVHDEGIDDALHSLRTHPRQALVLGQLGVLDDEDLPQEDDGREADDARHHAEQGHLEDRVRDAHHGFRGEEVRDEAERTPGRPHRGDDDHLGDRDLISRPHEGGEEEQGRDRRPLLHDAEAEREVAVDGAEDHGQDRPGDERTRGQAMDDCRLYRDHGDDGEDGLRCHVPVLRS
ncbi:MAG: hypothetical protein A3J66_00210 [Candidatus Magasanikbacteria bacterium RIFCSPHIGHO2_02_FULL_47_14]|uniref:Uncharacterized protein n=1 Tax=Candidatus Magasanikbacteria bacterium RIFCSPHIGHO2_02_FULL_47_14 TaxID=1798680 RepID=A0A1F6MA39_9BACT|nr:MAG: hypothetical protein A3J66_00210 [Candidatus Magasanikbacteria bacterium RIFCSPHIGHO2_02_FULL_47_14]